MKDMALYHEVPLLDLIGIEESLETFSRSSWDHVVDFELSPEGHLVWLDHERQRAILAYDALQYPAHYPMGNQLSLSQQVFDHWLLGTSRDRTIDASDHPELKRYLKTNKNRLTEEALELFCGGRWEALVAFRTGFEIEAKDDRPESPDWTILHHPFAVGGLEERVADTELDKGMTTTFAQWPEYEPWLAYGVVSQSHFVRTDKREVLSFVESYVEQRGYDITAPRYGRDVKRNFEPIVVWPGAAPIGDHPITLMVGINFGYDNGRSSYRLGIGAHFWDHRLDITHIPNRLLVGPGGEMPAVLERWIHHRDFGKLRTLLEQLFDEHLEPFFHRVIGLLESAEAYVFGSKEQSERVLLNTHRKAFSDYHDDLQAFHAKYGEGLGWTRLTHVLTWARLAGYIDGESPGGARVRSRVGALADHIAVSILGLPPRK